MRWERKRIDICGACASSLNWRSWNEIKTNLIRWCILWLVFCPICKVFGRMPHISFIDLNLSKTCFPVTKVQIPPTNIHFPIFLFLLIQFQIQRRNVLDINALNNTRRATKEILFFNRVPKVGSQTFMELLRLLAKHNHFNFHRDDVQRVEMVRLNNRQQYDLTRFVSQLPAPSVYIKHVCYTNFTKWVSTTTTTTHRHHHHHHRLQCFRFFFQLLIF